MPWIFAGMARSHRYCADGRFCLLAPAHYCRMLTASRLKAFISATA